MMMWIPESLEQRQVDLIGNPGNWAPGQSNQEDENAQYGWDQVLKQNWGEMAKEAEAGRAARVSQPRQRSVYWF